jgi:phosphopantetheinyl transferase
MHRQAQQNLQEHQQQQEQGATLLATLLLLGLLGRMWPCLPWLLQATAGPARQQELRTGAC